MTKTEKTRWDGEREKGKIHFQDWLSKERHGCSTWQKYSRMSLWHSTGKSLGKSGECTCVKNICKWWWRKVRTRY